MRIFARIGQARHAVAAHEVDQLLGQPGPQGQGVQVLHQAEELADAARMQPQQRLVQLGVRGQDLLEVGLGHAQDGGVAMRIRIVRAPVAVEDGHVADPDARLHVGQRDLLARHRGRADAHRTQRTRDPVFRRLAAGGDQLGVFVAFDVSASKDVVAKRRGER
jgi:hypothetical protein